MEYSSIDQCTNDSDNQGYTDLGWLNSGIDIPKGAKFENIYSSPRRVRVYSDSNLKLYFLCDGGN